MNGFKFETALQKVSATRAFLALLCCTAAESAGYIDLGEYYDLFNVMEETCKAGLEELASMLKEDTSLTDASQKGGVAV